MSRLLVSAVILLLPLFAGSFRAQAPNDPQGQFVTYRTSDNRKVERPVMDKRVLEGIRAGDRVEITFTRARAIRIERGRR